MEVENELTVGSYSPRHADLTVTERENLCTVGEWDRPFSGGIKGAEQEDEECDCSQMCFGVGFDGYQEA